MKSPISVLTAIIFLSLNVFAQADIHKVDFRNFTYQPHCAGEEIQNIAVKNGEFTQEKQMDGYVDRMYFEVRGITYGDLNSDGKDEAIIISNCNTGGTGQFTEGFVYTIKSGKPSLWLRIPGGDRADGGLREARVENALLVVDSNEMGEMGGACCPEIIVTSRYKIVNGKLTEVGRPTKREIYPSRRVSFAHGTSGSTMTLTIRPSEGNRLVVGARAGQILSVALNTDKVEAHLLEDATMTEVKNGFSARLPKNGDYTVQLANYGESAQTVIVTITIK